MQEILLLSIIINSFLYGSGTLLRKHVVDKRNIETVEYLVIMLFVKAILLIGLFFIVDKNQQKLMYPNNLLNKFKQNYDILFLIKTLGIMSFFLYMYVLKNSPLTWSIPLFAITKITITVLLSILIFKEKITPYRIGGLFLGFVSIYMLK